MQRYLEPYIGADLKNKMVLLVGPRQVGKTYLSTELQKKFKNPLYLNYDNLDHAKIIRQKIWPTNTDFLILDEIHKMKDWKQYIKGTYDTKPPSQNILVTGSARLDTFRQSGDSLAGRYFKYRLCPISVKEIANQLDPYEAINQLNILGGFPEPFLSASETTSKRWQKQYYTDLIREDIFDFGRIHEINTIKTLLEMLRKRVGSPVSYLSLATDLQVSPNTIKSYISILENLFIIFLIRPFHKNIARAILKEPKVYFYDSGYVLGDEGIKLENTVAVCLQKHCYFLQDTTGNDINLAYIRTKEGKEIDFVIEENGTLQQCIEVKLSDKNLSPTLKYFKAHLPNSQMIQLVHNLQTEYEENNILVVKAGKWLAELSA